MVLSWKQEEPQNEPNHKLSLRFLCSAGVGRTGTLISLDYLLEQAAAEGVIDVFHCVYQMRKNRVNMIQTLVWPNNFCQKSLSTRDISHKAEFTGEEQEQKEAHAQASKALCVAKKDLCG